MKARKKEIVILSMLVIILLFFVTLSAFIWIGSNPTTGSAKIWLPKDYSIENLKDGTYVPIKSFDGASSALYVSFEAYRELFSVTKSNVAVEKDGTIYYVAEYDGKAFFASDYLKSSWRHQVKVINVHNDGSVDTRQERYELVWSFGAICAFMAIIIAFLLIDEVRNPTFKS